MILESVLIIGMALLLDNILGEARRYHPLAGFGYCAAWLERRLNLPGNTVAKLNGVVALLMLLLPPVLALMYLQSLFMPQLIGVLVVYLVIGRKSLSQHALAVARPLEQNDLPTAREKIALIVSRDTQHMDQQQVTTAGIETVIENSNDAIFAALFWFLLAGAPAALIYRLVNTLDAMWGYKNDRYINFGWAAARLDDVLNWLPARLTVFSFAVLGGFAKVWRTAFQQGLSCSSKNAGPVMAAGACALNIKLGGEAYYQGRAINKPELGCGKRAEIADIQRSLSLVDKTLVLWMATLVFLAMIVEVI